MLPKHIRVCWYPYWVIDLFTVESAILKMVQIYRKSRVFIGINRFQRLARALNAIKPILKELPVIIPSEQYGFNIF